MWGRSASPTDESCGRRGGRSASLTRREPGPARSGRVPRSALRQDGAPAVIVTDLAQVVEEDEDSPPALEPRELLARVVREGVTPKSFALIGDGEAPAPALLPGDQPQLLRRILSIPPDDGVLQRLVEAELELLPV